MNDVSAMRIIYSMVPEDGNMDAEDSYIILTSLVVNDEFLFNTQLGYSFSGHGSLLVRRYALNQMAKKLSW